MPFPTRDLDNRTFQNIVDDVKQQIGLRCPEWTDHNVSDPGVTLIELFAFVVEQMLFQLNQVPDKNYVKFLEMIGVRLEMPRPAIAEIRYLLSRVIDDADPSKPTESNESDGLRIVVPKDSVAATPRTESEEPVQFLTDRDLDMVRPRLTAVVSVPAEFEDAEAVPSLQTVRAFDLAVQEQYISKTSSSPDDEAVDNSFSTFGSEKPGIATRNAPSPGDRVCFGFATDVSGYVIDLVLKCATNRATGVVAEYPNQIWEFWDGKDQVWKPLELLRDDTGGFTKDGAIRLALPENLEPKTIAGTRATWIRCRYSIDSGELPNKPNALGVRSAYKISPGIYGLRARTVGGTVLGANCSRIYRERLGESDGKAGQVFKTRFSPVHPLSTEEVIVTYPLGEDQDSPNRVDWRRVEDFADSGSDDRHFVLDELTGEISFGPLIDRPDGGPPDRHGSVPDKGHQIVLTGYRVGGGTIGNVREGRICVDKGSLQYVASVENPRPARNGRDMESMDHAKLKAIKILKTRNRAVTKEDYELIALEKHGVGRACCLQPLHPYAHTGADVPAGMVKVLIVPALGDIAIPRIHDLVVPEDVRRNVKAHLDSRRLLTATLSVEEAKYVFVETEILLIPDPRLDPEMVVARVKERLNSFLHPLTGGPDRTGWPFGRPLTLTDIYVELSDKLGVALLREVKIIANRVGQPTSGRFLADEPVDPVRGLELNPDEVICTRRHNIRLLPISAQRLYPNGGTNP